MYQILSATLSDGITVYIFYFRFCNYGVEDCGNFITVVSKKVPESSRPECEGFELWSNPVEGVTFTNNSE